MSFVFICTMQLAGPIGVFDSGYGGLTVYRELVEILPEYDFIYLGDNARVPYGTRSYETVYKYTWQCTQQLFAQNCNLVILACNTASAKALRSIQQHNLPEIQALKRVLGVIRPTAEVIGSITGNNHVGVFATEGTVKSESYRMEIGRFSPEIKVTQEACPMWVPLIEGGYASSTWADYFVRENIDNLLKNDPEIDSIILGCTHYPLLEEKIRSFLPNEINLVSQGGIVANSLKDYMQRHPEIDALCAKNGHRKFFTTDDPAWFNEKAKQFLDLNIESKHIDLS